MDELVFNPAEIDLKEESYAFDHEKYDKWKEFRICMYDLHEMQNEGCRGCERPPTECRECMQKYYWDNIKYYL